MNPYQSPAYRATKSRPRLRTPATAWALLFVAMLHLVASALILFLHAIGLGPGGLVFAAHVCGAFVGFQLSFHIANRYSYLC